jgi:predicted 2-oxoglutarate/Fe(II)-dependent dioxygenase YbiX
LSNEIRSRSSREIETNFTLPRLLYPDFTILQANHPGDGHIAHADNCRYEPAEGKWVDNHTPQHALTCGIYLNSSGAAFIGGDLVFPRLGITVQPQAGLFVAYPSDHRFEHEVPEVKSGVRYSMLIWFTDDPAFAEGPLAPRIEPVSSQSEVQNRSNSLLDN